MTDRVGLLTSLKHIYTLQLQITVLHQIYSSTRTLFTVKFTFMLMNLYGTSHSLGVSLTLIIVNQQYIQNLHIFRTKNSMGILDQTLLHGSIYMTSNKALQGNRSLETNLVSNCYNYKCQSYHFS